jgi:hypothetical protein
MSKNNGSTYWKGALVAALALHCGGASAAESAAPAAEVKMEKPVDAGASRNRFDLRARFQFNVKASFGGIGGFTAQNAAGTPVGTRMYDDGFVLDDPDGNTPSAGGPLTDNWQYQNGSQVREAGASVFLDMNISSAIPSLATPESEDGVQPGFEMVYSRELGRGERTAWGLQGAVGYTRSSISDNRGLSGAALVFTDSFDVTAVSVGSPPTIPSVAPGAAPPPAGSTGTLIPVTPAPGSGTTTIVAGGSVTSGARELETDIVGFRVGPYLEYSLSESVSLSLGAGGVGAVINSQFAYNESTTIPGMGPALQPGVSATQASSGSVSDTEFKGGAYAEISLNARLNERWDASLGAQYQYTGRFGQRVDTHTASLNLEQSIGVFGGIRFKF